LLKEIFSMDEQLKQIQQRIRAEDFAVATTALEHYLRDNPDSTEGWYLLSFAVHDPQKQLHALRKAAQLDPDNARIQQRLVAVRAQIRPATRTGRGSSGQGWRIVLPAIVVLVLIVVGAFLLLGDGDGSDDDEENETGATVVSEGAASGSEEESSTSTTTRPGRQTETPAPDMTQTITARLTSNARQTQDALTENAPTNTHTPAYSPTVSPTSTARVVIQAPTEGPSHTPTATITSTLNATPTVGGTVTNIFITSTPSATLQGTFSLDIGPAPPTSQGPDFGPGEPSATATPEPSVTPIPTTTLAPPFSIADAVPLGTPRDVGLGTMVVLRVWRPAEEAIEGLDGDVEPAPTGESWVLVEVAISCDSEVICEPDPATDLQIAGSSDARYGVQSTGVLPELGENSYFSGQVFGYTGATVPASESGLWLLYTAPSGVTHAFALQ
jgi:hypothetical protein